MTMVFKMVNKRGMIEGMPLVRENTGVENE